MRRAAYRAPPPPPPPDQSPIPVSPLSLSPPILCQGPQDASQQNHTQPDKVGWIRKFCGKGIFREIWKNRFVILKGDQLYISEKEVSYSIGSDIINK